MGGTLCGLKRGEGCRCFCSFARRGVGLKGLGEVLGFPGTEGGALDRLGDFGVKTC